jgi:hypothetical protein
MGDALCFNMNMNVFKNFLIARLKAAIFKIFFLSTSKSVFLWPRAADIFDTRCGAHVFDIRYAHVRF